MFRKVAIAFAATAMLAACGGTKTVYVVNTDAPDTTVKKSPETTEAPTPTLPPWTPEDEFIFDIENSYGLVYLPDSDLFETGYLVCSTLRGGASASDIVLVLATLDQPELAVAITTSAVLNLCPDQLWKFEGLS